MVVRDVTAEIHLSLPVTQLKKKKKISHNVLGGLKCLDCPCWGKFSLEVSLGS